MAALLLWGNSRLLSLAVLFSIAFSGCKVGPNYRFPAPTMPEKYSEGGRRKTTAAADDQLVNWWAIFCDPFLDQLLQQTLSASFDYRIALERICQARATYRMQYAQIWPEIDSDFQATRFHSSNAVVSAAAPATGATTATKGLATPSLTQNFFQLGFDAVWELDIFGGLRRAAQAAYDTWQATDEQARAVKISLLSEVASIYVNICALQKKIALAIHLVQLDEKLLRLSLSLVEAGLADELQLEAVRAAMQADQASLTALETSCKQAIYSLAVLVGEPPEMLVERFRIARPIPAASGKIPAGLPADLLRRRPDIKSAERLLAASTEQIGVAVAALFPQLSLTGSGGSFASNPLQGANIGYASDSWSKLFSPQARLWGFGGFITWPAFDFGKRSAAVDVQVSMRNQAYLSYQKTIITALQEVEQALYGYFNEEKRVQQLVDEAHANKKSLDLTTSLYQAGLTDYSQLLQREQVWLNSINTLTDSEQALSTQLIATYKALGGDW